MSVVSAPYYWLECDHHGCEIKSTDSSEFTAWADESYAVDSAFDSDWIEVAGKHYCDEHAAQYDPELQEES